MTERREIKGGDEVRLTAAEEEFVRRLAEAYAVPPLSPSRRVAFNAALERRLEQRRRRGRRAPLAGLAAVAALALLVTVRTWTGDQIVQPLPQSASTPRSAAVASLNTPEQALLAMLAEPSAEMDEALPDDYQAIESVFLGS